MIASLLEARIRKRLTQATAAPTYPVLVGLFAFGATLSMSVPFGSILVVATLLRRDKWLRIAILSSLGSALGGLVLYVVFHHLGWNSLIARYPDVVRSEVWAHATHWLSSYGIAALFLIAALPLPQTPALMVAGITRLPVIWVFLALLCGKIAKHTLYAWAVARFPEKFARYFENVQPTTVDANRNLPSQTR